MDNDIYDVVMLGVFVVVIICIAFWQWADDWRYSDDRVAMHAQQSLGRKASAKQIIWLSNSSVSVQFTDGTIKLYSVMYSDDPLATCPGDCIIL